MPKFLILASYDVEGVRGIQSAGGSSRRDAVAKALEGVGGTLESFHFSFGDVDAYVIVDAPDNVDRHRRDADRQRQRRRARQDRRAADARRGRRGGPEVGELHPARRLIPRA